jgi:hypothetical protein
MFGFRPRPLYLGGTILHYPLNRRLVGSQSWYGYFGEDINHLPVPRYAVAILGCPAGVLFFVLTELFRLYLYWKNKQGKGVPLPAKQAQMGGVGISVPLPDPKLGGCGWSVPRYERFTPGKRLGTHLQEAGWASGPVWMGPKSLTSSGFDLRTVQLSASCHMDYDIPAACIGKGS